MSRPREFDPEQALDRALNVFWTKGFEATSLDDLCEATRLGRSSLYAAFGDKRSLYLRALERYENGAVGRISAAVGGARSPRAGIAGFVERIIEDIVAGPGRRGCFIGNCAAELARTDSKTTMRVGQSLARVEATFRAALDEARKKGEIARDADIDALARFLTAGIQGLRLVGKANPDRAALRAIARVMLSCLDAPVTVPPRGR
jgi:TetR/AcrR family transcriptional repressor of nem operon